MRFSSFGDVTQSLSISHKLKVHFPGAEIHFLTRADFRELCESCPSIDQVHTLNRNISFKQIFALVSQLKRQNYSHIYDAHNSLRSKVICWFLRPPLALERLFNPPLFTRKTQKRWKRFLLFKFRINFFKKPFSGQRDLLEPLEKWGINSDLPPAPVIKIPEILLKQTRQILIDRGITSKFICLAPSAAHPLKRWPLEYWQKLADSNRYIQMVCLGGRDDKFISEIEKIAPQQVINLAGELNLAQSAAVISQAELLVANDTGLLHVAEQLGKKAIALMGPAPFGFPSRVSTRILEVELPCRPCSKHGQGPCTNPVYQQCLKDISPTLVGEIIRQEANHA